MLSLSPRVFKYNRKKGEKTSFYSFEHNNLNEWRLLESDFCCAIFTVLAVIDFDMLMFLKS